MQSAISIFGIDKPGIIASLTGVLAEKGVNIEDASMTLLQGHFAMILVIDDGKASQSEIQDALRAVEGLKDLSVTFSNFEPGASIGNLPETVRYVFHLSASDTPGIVASVAKTLSNNGANVVDCSTRKNNDTDVFTMILDVDIPVDKEDVVVQELADAASQYSGDVILQRVDEVDL